MSRSLSGLCVAGLGLCAGGWIIREAIARRRRAARPPGQDRASAVYAMPPAERATWTGDAVPRGSGPGGPAPAPPLEPLPVQGTRWVPERRGPHAAADGEDAWW